MIIGRCGFKRTYNFVGQIVENFERRKKSHLISESRIEFLEEITFELGLLG